MKEKQVTIIVPVYNVEKYLAQCIDSILCQTYHNIEVILVDDGSTDRSSDICDEYGLKDNRVTVIHKENGGLSSARNAGIEKGQGEYIGFVDSDDYIHPKMIEILYSSIEQTKSDIAVCGLKYVYDNDFRGERKESDLEIYDGIIDSGKALEEIMDSKKWQYRIVCNKLYKKGVFEKIQFEQGYIHEDEIIIHRIFGQCKKIVLVSEELYNYRQREGSIMSREYNIRRLDYCKALEDRIVYFNNIGRKDLAKKASNEFWNLIVRKYFIFDRNNENVFYLNRILRSYRKILRYLLKELTCNWKEKISMIVFAISPKLYKYMWN